MISGPGVAPGLMGPEKSEPPLVQAPRTATWDVHAFYGGPRTNCGDSVGKHWAGKAPSHVEFVQKPRCPV